MEKTTVKMHNIANIPNSAKGKNIFITIFSWSFSTEKSYQDYL